MRKILIIILSSILVLSALWFLGLETLYARFLVFLSNTILQLGGRESYLAMAEDSNACLLQVYTRIEGQSVTYPQEVGPVLLPVLIIFAWQILTAFYLTRKKAMATTGLNVFLFTAFQVFFFLLITAYHTSALASYLVEMMIDSFYIIAIFIIIIDYIRHPSRMLAQG